MRAIEFGITKDGINYRLIAYDNENRASDQFGNYWEWNEQDGWHMP